MTRDKSSRQMLSARTDYNSVFAAMFDLTSETTLVDRRGPPSMFVD
jgi:hypothetical protein